MNESCVLTNLILSTKITPFWGSSQAKTYLFYKLFPLILATPFHPKSSFHLITLYAAHDNISHESNTQMILANQRWTPFLECKYHHKCGGTSNNKVHFSYWLSVTPLTSSGGFVSATFTSVKIDLQRFYLLITTIKEFFFPIFMMLQVCMFLELLHIHHVTQ